MAMPEVCAQLRSAVDEVVRVASAESGGAAAPCLATTPLSLCDVEALKRQAPLSVFKMADGAFRFVPRSGAVRAPAGGEVSLKLSADGKDRGTYESVTTLLASVEATAWGCMTVHGQAGEYAAELRVGGMPVRMRPDPAGPTFDSVLLSLAGGVEQRKPVEEALQLANVKWQHTDNSDPSGPPRARTGGGLLTLDQAAVA